MWQSCKNSKILPEKTTQKIKCGNIKSFSRTKVFRSLKAYFGEGHSLAELELWEKCKLRPQNCEYKMKSKEISFYIYHIKHKAIDIKIFERKSEFLFLDFLSILWNVTKKTQNLYYPRFFPHITILKLK